MLAYSIKHYLPTRCGIFTVECELGYLYIDAKAYNSGVLLTEQYLKSSYNELHELFKPDNMETRASVKECFDKLPNPIKPLAFLLYATKIEYTEFPKQVGALDIILSSIFPTYYLNVPKNQRVALEFGPVIEEEYELDWKNFFDSCIDYDTLLNPPEETEKHPIFVIQASNGVPVGNFTPTAPAFSDTASSNSGSDDEGELIVFDEDAYLAEMEAAFNSTSTPTVDTSSSSSEPEDSAPEEDVDPNQRILDDAYADLF